MLQSLALLALAAFLPASVPVAQDLPKPEDIERRARELEELKRRNAELQREAARQVYDAEATLARLGGTRPWPPPDPSADSIASWRDALRAAPRVSGAEIAALVPVLRLQASRSAGVQALFANDQEFMTSLVEAVHLAGHRTHPDRVATLRIGVSAELSSDGEAQATVVHSEVLLVAPARVLRGAYVHHAEVQLAYGSDLRVVSAAPTQSDVRTSVQRAVVNVFANLARASAPARDASPWDAWLADDSRAADCRVAFESSRRGEAELNAGLENVVSFAGLDLDLSQQHEADAALVRARSVELQDHWRGLLEAAGLAIASAPAISGASNSEANSSVVLANAPTLVHALQLDAPTPGGAPVALRAVASRLAVREGECLTTLGGDWLRVRGDSCAFTGLYTLAAADKASDSENERAASTLEQRVRAAGRVAAGDALKRLMDGRARGGAPPVPPHPDGEAVASFLRTRAMVEVPESVLIDLSNLIARILAESPGIPASMRAEWIVEYDGRRWLDLPQVGQARSGTALSRSVRDAVDRAVDRVTLADPMALAAFYDIWMHDRGYRRPVLPDGFGEQLRGRRPSGGGALLGVQVLGAFDFAMEHVRRLERSERAPHVAALDAIRAQLADARVLVCEYIPADGNLSYALERALWYRSAPANWSELAAKLPSGQPLSWIGPAQSSAPATLREADALLGATADRRSK